MSLTSNPDKPDSGDNVAILGPVTGESPRQSSGDDRVIVQWKTRRWKVFAAIGWSIGAFGIGNVGAQFTSPHTLIEDHTAAVIGKTFADTVKESNDRLVREIAAMNDAALARDEWCKRFTQDMPNAMKDVAQGLKNLDTSLKYVYDRLDRIEKEKGS